MPRDDDLTPLTWNPQEQPPLPEGATEEITPRGCRKITLPKPENRRTEMPNQNEQLAECRRERDELKSRLDGLQMEAEHGERLLEAERAELQAQRVKHEREKAQLADAAEIAMKRASECRKRAEQAEARAEIAMRATDTLVATVQELWKLIAQAPPREETPQGYPAE